MTPKRLELAICTRCGGVKGLNRAIVGACECPPTHAGMAQVRVVIPVTKEVAAQLDEWSEPVEFKWDGGELILRRPNHPDSQGGER